MHASGYQIVTVTDDAMDLHEATATICFVHNAIEYVSTNVHHFYCNIQ